MTGNGFAQDEKVVALGMVVVGSSVEPQAFAGVVKSEGHTPVSVTRREGVEVGSGSLTFACLSPKAGRLMQEGSSHFGSCVRGSL